MLRWLTPIAAAATLMAGTATSNAADLGIATGGTGGTYYPFGKNIAALAEHLNLGIDIDVRNSKGSLMNAWAVRYTPNVQLAIAQSDTLDFLRAYAEGALGSALPPEDQAELRRLVDSLKMVVPLYIEEIHVLARKDVRSLSDLEGRRVAVGQNGSGTYISAEHMFRTAGIRIDPQAGWKTNDAINELRLGNLDAVVYVAGQPTKTFIENVAASDDFHFVPINEPALFNHYEAATLRPDSYPWLNDYVETVGVRSLLIAYDYGLDNENCKLIGTLAKEILGNLPWLQDNGHEKWFSVSFDADVLTWDTYSCAQVAGAQQPNDGGQPSDGQDLPSFLDRLKR